MKLRALAFGLACIAFAQTGLRAAALSDQQQQWLRAAERHERAGWIYVHIEGEPRERGFQHGYLLSKEIAECLRVVGAHWQHETSLEWTWLVAHTKRFIERGIDPEDRAELQGHCGGDECGWH